MPPSKHKRQDQKQKKEQHTHPRPKKRQQITDSSGWTHVLHGPKHGATTTSPNLRSLHLQSIDLGAEIAPSDLAQTMQTYDRSWRESECCQQLRCFFERDVSSSLESRRLQNCVCLGLGSLTAGRESSKHQLATLTWMLDLLRERHVIDPVVLQDPAFTPSDVRYLTRLGYRVLASPHGFQEIHHHTFLFAPHLERNVYATALEGALPPLCVGSDLQTLIDRPFIASTGDDEAAQAEIAIFQRFSNVMHSRAMPSFDGDTWCYFTNIYWSRDSSNREETEGKP